MRALLLALVAGGLAHGAAPPAGLTPEQTKLLRQGEALWARAKKRWEAGEQAQAIASMNGALRAMTGIYGEEHKAVYVASAWLASWEARRGRPKEAAAHARRMWRVMAALRGEGDWRAVDCRLAWGELLAEAKRTPAQREALRRATALTRQASLLCDKGQSSKAVPLARQALEISRQVRGEKDHHHAACLNNLAMLYHAAGDHKAALPLFRQAISLRKELLGEEHPLHAACLNNLAMLYEDMGAHTAALPLSTRARDITRRALGERHAHYATSLINLAGVYKSLGDYRAALPLLVQAVSITEESPGPKHPAHATSLNALANLYQSMGRPGAALPLYQQALAIRKKTLGVEHPDYAQALNNLALVHKSLGDHKAALPLYRKALAITKAALGEKHPGSLSCLNNLALLHKAMGEYEEALQLYKKALALRKEALGGSHPDYAESLRGLAGLYHASGNYRAALPLHRQASDILEKALGERHPRYANSLSSQAGLLQAMGDLEAALPLFRQALHVNRAALGETHPACANSLNNLAELYEDMGRHKAALPLHERALAIRKLALGERHPDYANSLNNLSWVRHATGDHEAAIALSKQAVDIEKRALGEGHPHYATSLNNLALLYQAVGDHKAALPLCRQALDIRKRALGTRHPDYATSLHNLALLYQELGRPGAALRLHEQSMYMTRRQLGLDASVQSERQQRAAARALRYRLDVRLSLPDEAARFSHNHALSWKGSAFAAQQARRRFLLAQANPATRALAVELRDVCRSLALLVSRLDRGSLQRAEQLARRKEVLEGRLAQLSADFRLAVSPPTSERFRQGLPQDVVLLDFLVHAGIDPAKPLGGQEWQPRLVVWVVRPKAPTLRLNLGPMGPIEEDIQTWRTAIEKGESGAPIAARLREKVWSPLEKHLDGAKVVLVSPDAAVGRLPFAALPGKGAGKYLLEEVPLVILPVPQVLTQALERVRGKPALLALGDVEFGDGPGPWARLPATGPEALAVAARFRALFKTEAVTLGRTKATEAALLEALPKHRFIHLATHGFFASPDRKSYLGPDVKPSWGLFGRQGLGGWDPALLSGLVLAGANNPTLDDDGILTASEVAEMDLSGVELAVLSACQTGLGREAAGEGMLGLQRAFAMAGCKSVVGSLWSVHDAATAVLMERFYHHLWVMKLSKLEALRRAQLDVLRHPEWVEARAEKLRGVKGLRGVGKASERVVAGKRRRRSPPAWWAAWQLSGDWR